jgi:hypothetical protein
MGQNPKYRIAEISTRATHTVADEPSHRLSRHIAQLPVKPQHEAIRRA